MKLTEENYSGNYLGFDVIPKLMPLAADGKAAVFTELKQTNIPGKYNVCGYVIQYICSGHTHCTAACCRLLQLAFCYSRSACEFMTGTYPAHAFVPKSLLNARHVSPACTPAGKDIACGQKDWQGKPAAFCKICGGKAAVQMACMANSNCVAFDLEGADQYCGYLKSAKGPFKSPAQGFSSFVKA
jgi:hypothetical protein